MANTQSNGSDAGVGCLALIGLGIVLSVVGFVLEHWEFFLTAALVIGGLVAAGAGLKAWAKRSSVGKRMALEASVEQARRAGEIDMRRAWMEWALGDLPGQLVRCEPAHVAERLAVIPKTDWTVPQLRVHGRAVWILREGAERCGRLPEADARLSRVAAMISDLVDDTFDTARGQTTDEYLYHPEREVRAAYLEGGAKGVETIMDAITTARAQAREDAATKAAADSVAEQRNAALRALRETQRAAEAKDAHAAWEAEAKNAESRKIGE